MSHLTKSDHNWHRAYEVSSEALRFIIDDAYTALSKSIRLDASPIGGEFLKLCNCDGAEALVAAITRYVFESNPDHPEVRAAIEELAKEDAK